MDWNCWVFIHLLSLIVECTPLVLIIWTCFAWILLIKQTQALVKASLLLRSLAMLQLWERFEYVCTERQRQMKERWSMALRQKEKKRKQLKVMFWTTNKYCLLVFLTLIEYLIASHCHGSHACPMKCSPCSCNLQGVFYLFIFIFF